MPGRQAPAVHVTARQEELLRKLVRGTTIPQRLAVRAQIVLLLAAAGHSSEQIVEKLVVTRPMVRKWRRRWSASQDQLRVVEGEESDSAVQSRICEILADAPRCGRPSDISPEQILEIIAIACEDPEAAQRSFSHWTPGEVARESVRRGIIESISTRSVDRFLKGDRSSPPSPAAAKRSPTSSSAAPTSMPSSSASGSGIAKARHCTRPFPKIRLT